MLQAIWSHTPSWLAVNSQSECSRPGSALFTFCIWFIIMWYNVFLAQAHILSLVPLNCCAMLACKTIGQFCTSRRFGIPGGSLFLHGFHRRKSALWATSSRLDGLHGCNNHNRSSQQWASFFGWIYNSLHPMLCLVNESCLWDKISTEESACPCVFSLFLADHIFSWRCSG